MFRALRTSLAIVSLAAALAGCAVETSESDAPSSAACPDRASTVWDGKVCAVEGADCKYPCFTAEAPRSAARIWAVCRTGKWVIVEQEYCE